LSWSATNKMYGEARNRDLRLCIAGITGVSHVESQPMDAAAQATDPTARAKGIVALLQALLSNARERVIRSRALIIEIDETTRRRKPD
jgi:hypothetical protein